VLFLSCKANARVILAKTGHGPHSTKLVFVLTLLVLLFYVYFILFYVLFLYYSMYRLCVYVYKPLPPGVYPIAVDKYINTNISISGSHCGGTSSCVAVAVVFDASKGPSSSDRPSKENSSWTS
jgi:hypothetical protein